MWGYYVFKCGGCGIIFHLDVIARQEYTKKEQFEIFEKLKNKTFKDKIQCYECGDFFDPYKMNMHCCGEVVVSGFDEKDEVIAPPHFLCENCHRKFRLPLQTYEERFEKAKHESKKQLDSNIKELNKIINFAI